ncbi:MAG: magnesium chelatase subunit D [Gemmobacter sp.]|nr:magnesium chelatase subunit D [Gemmobacter sp.]
MAQAVALFRVAPFALGGLWLRGRAGPVRDRVLAALAPLNPAKLHPSMPDDAVMGGTDLAATLASGRLVRQAGLLERCPVLVLTQGENCPAGLAARMAQALDAGGRAVVALDEAFAEGEGLPRALADRLALFVDLDGLLPSDFRLPPLTEAAVAAAAARFARVQVADAALVARGRAAPDRGISSLRAPRLALAAAQAAAALRQADVVDRQDLELAAELVFAHRALPATDPPQDTAQDPSPPPPDPAPDSAEDQPLQEFPAEVLIEAARAMLPPDLLERLAQGRTRKAGGSGAGALRKGNRRGRPLPARAGQASPDARIDLVATLRAAAPWQAARARMYPRLVDQGRKLILLPSDLRARRTEDRSDRLLIFAVDASGSAAMARLGEAKGAVELLLARAYAARDHVALVAFRGTGAELVLPATRSLVQTKKRLAGVPGGGGTPLASGLQVALAAAQAARARGMAPTLAILTDGRANIALDGTANRPQAAQDAGKLAALIAASGVPAVVIDTGFRPTPALQDLARKMGARWLALPRCDSGIMAAALSASMEAPRT